ncbi:SDR family NAD(P)-dependent oxidoreductase [Dankookia sp. P2]|uniref:SDR family NAD(P)-dependent oxidoreductase n=1 Tax=Dankookia sp. P2 TaxID=3423955 RepID=UPI003D67AEDA
MTGSGRPILVTGGAGFIGANVADRLASEGHAVLVYDALARAGVADNLAWLRQRHPGRVIPIIADINDATELTRAMGEADAVFHLAAQVAVTSSLDDPAADFAVNLRGTLGVLEAARRQDRPVPVIFASTNKVYGDLADIPLGLQGEAYVPHPDAIRLHGIGEDRPLDFHTPYGCSKGAADQYVLDYARSFGVPSAVFRMSCIYGPLQRGTEDQGWVAHFLLRALARQAISIYGDGCQVRDILFVDDAVDAYVAAWRRIKAVQGRAFNLGGGPANAVSLLQVIGAIEETIGSRVEIRHGAWRAGDQRYYVSDTRRARQAFGLPAPKPWRQGLQALAAWLSTERVPAEAASHESGSVQRAMERC